MGREEVKASRTVHEKGGRGLAKLAERRGDQFPGGVLRDDWKVTFPIALRNTLAVPLGKLWEY